MAEMEEPGPEIVEFREAIAEITWETDRVVSLLDKAFDANQAIWDARLASPHPAQRTKVETDVEGMLAQCDAKLREAEAYAHAAGQSVATYLEQRENTDYFEGEDD